MCIKYHFDLLIYHYIEIKILSKKRKIRLTFVANCCNRLYLGNIHFCQKKKEIIILPPNFQRH